MGQPKSIPPSYFCASKMGASAISSSVLIICLTILVFTQKSLAYFVTVDAHAEECFFDKVKQGTKMSLMFEVAEGGFLDIDVRIEGPDGRTVHSGERESNGKYTFAAHMEGVYKYCFSNQMSTMTQKSLCLTWKSEMLLKRQLTVRSLRTTNLKP